MNAPIIPAEFEPLRLLGRGGMGEVWEVAHRETGGRYALKRVLLPDPESRQRFEREAVSAANLVSPHVVVVHTADVHGPHPYLLQEFMAGGSLADRLRLGPLPCDEARRVWLEIAAGVADAHAQGILHRDLKPDNVLFSAEGVAKVADFGLARPIHDSSVEALTHTGTLLGSPLYMAPEQVLDPRAVDERADLYSLGAILFALLTGRPPIESRGGTLALLTSVLQDPPPAPSELVPEVSASLDAICLRALSKDPADRYPTVAAFAAAVAACSDPAPGRRGWLLILPLVAAAVGVVALLAAGQAPAPAPATSAPTQTPTQTPAQTSTQTKTGVAPLPQLSRRLHLPAPKTQRILASISDGKIVSITGDRVRLHELWGEVLQGAPRPRLEKELPKPFPGPWFVASVGASALIKWGQQPVMWWGLAKAAPRPIPGLTSSTISQVALRGGRALLGDNMTLTLLDEQGRIVHGPAPFGQPPARQEDWPSIRGLAWATDDLILLTRSNKEEEVSRVGRLDRSALLLISLAAWQRGDRRPLQTLPVPLAGPVAVFSRGQGHEVAVGTRAGGLSVFRLSSEGELSEVEIRKSFLNTNTSCAAMAFTPQGDRLLLALGGKSLRQNALVCLRWPQLDSAQPPQHYATRPRSIAIDARGERALVCGDGGLVRVEELRQR